MARLFSKGLFFTGLLAVAYHGPAHAASVGFGEKPSLPAPHATDSVSKSVDDIGWKDGEMPVAAAGLKVSLFAGELDSPRSLYVLPNGDVLTAEATTGLGSANRVVLLRDADNNGQAEERFVFLDGLKKPFGMTVVDKYFYVANTDGVWRYPYSVGMTKIEDRGEKILELPAGGYNNHWTRNLLASPDGEKIYVSVGSGSNNAEHGMDNEVRRADILEINPDGSGEHVFASGLRNPVGMDWNPETGKLWAAVNERDKLGDDLVPDYITSVKEGGFYGWPYSYFGQNPDPRMTDDPHPELVAQAIVPDYAVGAHTASLGLAFAQSAAWPEAYRNGAFVAQHGSWNRSSFSGYKVAFIPFENGMPSGEPRDVLTGFLADAEKGEAHGRPVSVVRKGDAILVSDDTGNAIWRVTAQ